jgi:predicted RNA-binding protein YlqC (UPF0109 family)
MIEFTRGIVQALVDDPEKVVVTEVRGGQMTLLKIRVGPKEAGKVIGKNGRTIEALRTILNAAAAKEKRRVIVEIDGSFTHLRKTAPETPATRGPQVTTAAQEAIKWRLETSCSP